MKTELRETLVQTVNLDNERDNSYIGAGWAIAGLLVAEGYVKCDYGSANEESNSAERIKGAADLIAAVLRKMYPRDGSEDYHGEVVDY